MAFTLGLENKRQVYMATALLSVVFIAGGIEVKSYFFTPSPTSNASPSRPIPSSAAAGPAAVSAVPAASGQSTQRTIQNSSSQGADAEKLTNNGLDPTLHLERLAESEDVAYAGTGRNIFSADSIPAIPFETPAKGPRNSEPTVVSAPLAPPKPTAPPIDLKYFGYAQSSDKSLKAFFVHGEDIFMARTGDIVDHRYKVGAITPGKVEVTDLSYNNTQSLDMQAK
jgi:hypothetical protein